MSASSNARPEGRGWLCPCRARTASDASQPTRSGSDALAAARSLSNAGEHVVLLSTPTLTEGGTAVNGFGRDVRDCSSVRWNWGAPPVAVPERTERRGVRPEPVDPEDRHTDQRSRTTRRMGRTSPVLSAQRGSSSRRRPSVPVPAFSSCASSEPCDPPFVTVLVGWSTAHSPGSPSCSRPRSSDRTAGGLMARKTLAQRFEEQVDHSGEHHLWTGAPRHPAEGAVSGRRPGRHGASGRLEARSNCLAMPANRRGPHEAQRSAPTTHSPTPMIDSAWEQRGAHSVSGMAT